MNKQMNVYYIYLKVIFYSFLQDSNPNLDRSQVPVLTIRGPNLFFRYFYFPFLIIIHGNIISVTNILANAIYILIYYSVTADFTADLCWQSQNPFSNDCGFPRPLHLLPCPTQRTSYSSLCDSMRDCLS